MSRLPRAATAALASLGRQLRELRTLCKALDLVVEGEARRAADILAERVKATEAALHDDNWLKAQFVELLPREGSLLLETACQLALESKVKEAGQRMSWGQGKGRWTGRPDNSEPPPLQLSTLPEKGKKGEGKKGKGERPKSEPRRGGERRTF